jgi:hypothetical protein
VLSGSDLQPTLAPPPHVSADHSGTTLQQRGGHQAVVKGPFERASYASPRGAAGAGTRRCRRRDRSRRARRRPGPRRAEGSPCRGTSVRGRRTAVRADDVQESRELLGHAQDSVCAASPAPGWVDLALQLLVAGATDGLQDVALVAGGQTGEEGLEEFVGEVHEKDPRAQEGSARRASLGANSRGHAAVGSARRAGPQQL